MRPGIVQKEQQELQLRQQEQQQQESNAAWPHCCSARNGAGGRSSAVCTSWYRSAAPLSFYLTVSLPLTQMKILWTSLQRPFYQVYLGYDSYKVRLKVNGNITY